MRALPNTIIGLIEMLEKLYPQRCIKSDETRPEADNYSGKASLVVELRARFEAETKREKHSLPKILR